jgi:capsule polysaccharide export protein KpsC/LpsZ
MFKAKILTNTETKKRKEFLDKFSLFEIEDKKFLYFPLHTEPEAKILTTSPFFSNQLTVIENIARSLPIDYILYVKEHPGQGLKLWRSIEYYKKILDLPNVKLIHPTVNPQDLISKCSCVISISGSTGFEALFYKKPVILFSDEYYDCLSMVTKVNDLTHLPQLISKILTSFKFNNKEFNALIMSNNLKSISFPYFQIMKDALTISLLQRKNKNYKITEKEFKNFYTFYKKDFDVLGNEFMKKL